MSLTKVTYSMINGAPANVLDFGADPTGVDDSTTAFQNCADTGANIVIPAGSYRITAAIQLTSGQIVNGANSGNFSASDKTLITNNTVGSGCFWYTLSTVTTEEKMPTLQNMSLVGDYPVRFNNEQTAIVIVGGASNVPYGMRPFVINCDISPRVAGTGIGVSWSKMFDGAIEDCEIANFDINVLLNGCDLNRVSNNRIRSGYSYQILELSVNTFGSQNEISHNDILQPGSSSCIFIKSAARHTRIYDNYLESGGVDGAALIGYIDCSSVNAPVYAGNTPGERHSIVTRDNRIDGYIKASSFIYRFEPEGTNCGEFSDVGTVGEPPTATVLAIVNAAGTIIDEIPFIWGQINAAAYKFFGPKFAKWNGYTSDYNYSLSVNGENLGMFGSPQLYVNLAANYLRAQSKKIVFLNGFTSFWNLSYPSSTALFSLSATYDAEVIARCVSGTETLSFGPLINTTGGSLTAFTLTNQFKPYTITFTSGASASDAVGLYFSRSNNGSNIEIESIKITYQ